MEVIKNVWGLIENQVLGMKWRDGLISGLLKYCGLDPAGRLGGTIRFFF